MSDFVFDRDAYLYRVGLKEEVKVTVECLKALHEAQAYSIPFENLDIPLGRPILLDPQSIFDKLVSRNRGGYCFELNGLFHLALQEFGFTSRRVLARVLYGRTTPGPKTHLAMIVTLGGQEWLADVGFGGPGMISPLPVKHQNEHTQGQGVYRLLLEDENHTLQKRVQEVWTSLYMFNREPVTEMDVQMSNFYTSCFPQSRFKTNRICTIPTREGRTILQDMELSIQKNNEVAKVRVEPGEPYVKSLKEHFGIPAEQGFYEFR